MNWNDKGKYRSVVLSADERDAIAKLLGAKPKPECGETCDVPGGLPDTAYVKPAAKAILAADRLAQCPIISLSVSDELMAMGGLKTDVAFDDHRRSWVYTGNLKGTSFDGFATVIACIGIGLGILLTMTLLSFVPR